MANSRRTKLMLVGFIAVLCLQFAVALYWSEPYPAIMMPGFPSSPATTGRISVRSYRVVATGPVGSPIVVNARQFFDGVPHSYLLTDMPFLLDSTPEPVADGVHFRLRLQRRSKLRSDVGVPAFANFARRRLAELTGRTDWETLRIEETRRPYDLDQASYVDSALPVRSREFRLR